MKNIVTQFGQAAPLTQGCGSNMFRAMSEMDISDVSNGFYESKCDVSK